MFTLAMCCHQTYLMVWKCNTSDDALLINIDAGSVMIDMSTVIQPDILTDNGVVHVINAVLSDDELQ